MKTYQTFVWGHAFSFPQSTKSIFLYIIHFLLKVKFNGENEVLAINHFLDFEKKCKYHKIGTTMKNTGYFSSL